MFQNNFAVEKEFLASTGFFFSRIFGIGQYVYPLPRDFQASSDLIKKRSLTVLKFDFAAKLLHLRSNSDQHLLGG